MSKFTLPYNYTFPPLRLMTAGHVDDGKSTLLGRILTDSNALYDDHLAEIIASQKEGSLDYSLAFDGLDDERKQGITIDVGYRYFRTKNRIIILADAPGHEEYTLNAASVAANSELCLLLVDIKRGLSDQTKRHLRIAALFGIKHVIVALNKIDQVNFEEDIFLEREKEAKEELSKYPEISFHILPISARFGDNVTVKSENTPYYIGETLLEILENIQPMKDISNEHMRFPVSFVNRPNQDFRGFAGTLTQGSLKVGDEVLNPRSMAKAKITEIYQGFDKVVMAQAGLPLTITLDKDLDITRGDSLTSLKNPPLYSDRLQVQALNCWKKPISIGDNFTLRLGHSVTSATVIKIEEDKPQIEANEICGFTLLTSQAVLVEQIDEFALDKFMLFDRVTFQPAALGVIRERDRGEKRAYGNPLVITKELRAKQKKQKPKVLWFTGLSGSGKTTIANALEQNLYARGKHSIILDGDLIRKGLSSDLGFSHEDRIENIRRVSEVAKIMMEAGLIVMVCLISPYEADRKLAKALIGDDHFFEIFINTPLDECIKRDTKGLYNKALTGQLKGLTGIDSPYEAPKNPQFSLNTLELSVEVIIGKLQKEINF